MWKYLLTIIKVAYKTVKPARIINHARHVNKIKYYLMDCAFARMDFIMMEILDASLVIQLKDYMRFNAIK